MPDNLAQSLDDQRAAALLKHFTYAHLPPHLVIISKPFCNLARDMEDQLYGPELVAGLRKLLEAKDCCVRAALT